jgi:DNA invertase Pin-like site-specific DNA recombinase
MWHSEREGDRRPKIDPKIEKAIRASLASGKGILKTARELKVGSGTVQRVKQAMVKQG